MLSTTRSSLWDNSDLPLTVKSCDWSQGQLTGCVSGSALRATTCCVLSCQRLSSAGQLCSGHSPSLWSALHCYLLPLLSLLLWLCVTLRCGPCVGPGLTVATVSPRHHPRPVSTCPVLASAGQALYTSHRHSHTGGWPVLLSANYIHRYCKT